MDLPIPAHLQSILLPVGSDNSEFQVTGKIRCTCGCETFEVWESNERLIVKAVCKECQKELLLFDSGKHGWNGFVCKEDYLDREKPFEQYCCAECKEKAFGITIRIASQGKQDFEEECLAYDDSFSLQDWVNAFEWITISLHCDKCALTSEEWLDSETM